MIFRQFPRSLAVRIRNFYEHLATNTCPFDEKEILAKLTPNLQAETVNFLLSDTIKRVPLIAALPDVTHMIIFDHLVPCTYSAGQCVFGKGDVATELLFLVDGIVEAISSVKFLPSIR